jgi:CHAT domain-containing protein
LVGAFLRETSEYVTGDDEHIKIGFKLYETLIACHQKNLDENHIKKVYIVPHRQLHYLPWTALSTSPENKKRIDYIIDHYEISVLPSAIAIQSFQEDNILDGQHCSDFFVGYDVAFTREDDVRQYDCSGFFIGKTVNKKNVLASLAEKEVVVLYAHGQFDGPPLSAGLDLTGDKVNIVTLLDLNNVDIKSKLVMLPGCETGTAKRYTELLTEGLDQQYPEADDLLGLYKVLLSKGVANIVMSSQKTPQCEATDDFQVSMFDKVKKGKEPCSSFREAICEIKNRYNKPQFWSPYIFIGN